MARHRHNHMPYYVGLVEGAKGGSKGGAKASAAPYTAPNDLRSAATARAVDLLSEGPILGFVDGHRSVFFDDTPWQNADDSYNFEGVVIEARDGDPVQAPLDGFSNVESVQGVGVKATFNLPVTRSITDQNADKFRLTVQVPGLSFTNAQAMVGSEVYFKVQVAYAGGAFQDTPVAGAIRGKTSSAYYKSFELPLPINPNGSPSYPWQVRLVRLSADEEAFPGLVNGIFLHSITSIVSEKFTYPNSALVGLQLDAQLFGGSVPKRGYEIYGRIIEVPTNYNPETRVYTGIWDGTFKNEWSDSPPWIFRDIILNKLYGLGKFIKPHQVDKWALYEAAQYCDQLVPDGYGGEEPRFTFNGCIREQKEAYEVLNAMSNAFRAMTYWGSGAVTAVQDRPKDVSMLVTESNTIGGFLPYSSSALKARHTMVMVTWNNPDNGYKQEVEIVQDVEAMRRYGVRTSKVDAIGCTSRGQAHRYGKWILFSEIYETQVLAYSAGVDHASARPGDIIAVQDPSISFHDFGGRLKSACTTTLIRLDKQVTLAPNKTYTIHVRMPDGSVEERDVLNGAGNFMELTTEAFPTAPLRSALWALATPELVPQLFNIVAAREKQPHVYEIIALQHEPDKFPYVDGFEIDFEPLPVSDGVSLPLPPPSDPDVVESLYMFNGAGASELTLSWVAPLAPFVIAGYMVTMTAPDGTTTNFPINTTSSITISNTTSGIYKFAISTVNIEGRMSVRPLLYEYTATGFKNLALPTVTALTTEAGNTTFTGQDCSIVWTNNAPVGVPAYAIRNVVRVYDVTNNALLHKETVDQSKFVYSFGANVNDGGPRRSLKFSVTALDILGREGVPALLTAANPPPSVLTVSVISTPQSLNIMYQRPSETDFAGVLIYLSATNGFVPGSGNLIYDGPNNAITYPLAAGVYYIRIAAYDSFGKTGLALSAQQQVETLKIRGVDLNLLAAEKADLIRGIVDETSFATGNQPIKTFTVLPTVKSTDLILSGSPPVLHRWNPTTNAYEIAISSANLSGMISSDQINSIAATKVLGSLTGASLPSANISGLVTSEQVDTLQAIKLRGTIDVARIAAVNASAITGGIVKAQITSVSATALDGQVTNDQIQSLAAAKVAGTLTNAIIDASKLTGTVISDRIVAGSLDAKINEVAVNKLIGQITNVQISDNAIKAPQIEANAVTALKIAAGSITASKLVLSDPSNVLINGSLQNIKTGEATSEGWTLLGQTYLSPSFANDPGGQIRIVNDTSGYIMATSDAFDVVPGDWLYVSGMGLNSRASGAIALLLNFQTADGGFVTNVTTYASNTKNAWLKMEGNGLVPSGCNKAQLYLIADVATGTVAFGKLRVRRASDAALIVDGAILARHITVNTLEGDRIKANTLDAGKIIAGSIKTRELDVGAVTAQNIATGTIIASNLAVGVGTNMLSNSDFLSGSDNLELFATPGPGTASLVRVGSDVWNGAYRPKGMNSVLIQRGPVTSTAQYLDVVVRRPLSTGWTDDYPVTPGERLEFYYHVACHNATSFMYLQFTDEAGTHIKHVFGTTASNNFPEMRNLDAARRHGAIVNVPTQKDDGTPATPTRVRVIIRVLGVGTEFMSAWITGLYLGKATSHQTVFSAWSPGISTTINGFGVQTRSLNASAIIADSITADEIGANSISTRALQADIITAKHLVLSDTTNIMKNGTFSNIVTGAALKDGWGFGQFADLDAPGPNDPGGMNRLTMFGRTGVFSHYFDVNDNETFTIELMMANVSDHPAYTQIEFYNENRTTITGSAALLAAAGGGWLLRSGKFKAPVGSRTARILIYVDRNEQNYPGKPVHAGKIRVRRTANSVMIVDGAITTNHMTANTIDAGVLTAGSITAGKITVSDPSNMLPNGNFENMLTGLGTMEGWTVEPSTVLNASGDNPGGKYRLLTYSVNGAISNWIDCQPLEPFYLSGFAYPLGGTAYLLLQFFNTAGAYVGQSDLQTSVANDWRQMEGRIVAPANAFKMRLVLHTPQFQGGTYWGKIRLRRAVNAAMVVDGSIVARTLYAGVVEADKIQAVHLAANSVTAAKITAGAITAGKLSLADANNLIMNGAFMDATTGAESLEGWTKVSTAGYISRDPNDIANGPCRYTDNTNTYPLYNTQFIDVKPGEKLFVSVSCYNYRTSGGAMGLLMQFWNDTAPVENNFNVQTGVKNAWSVIRMQVQAPAGCIKLRVHLFGSDPSLNIAHWGQVVIRRTTTTLLIVDGAIRTQQLYSGEIEADKIQAGNISVGAITATQIAAGAIIADKIGVSVSQNVLENSDGKAGLLHYVAGFHNSPIAPSNVILEAAGNWAPPGLLAIYRMISGNPGANYVFDINYVSVKTTEAGAGTPDTNAFFPVTAGKWYESNAYVSAHRCTVFAHISFYDKNRNYIGDYHGVGNNAASKAVNSDLVSSNNKDTATDAWSKAGSVVIAPAGACFAGPFYRAVTKAGQADPYLFVSGWYFGLAVPNQKELTPYSPASGTLISGQQIIVRTLKAINLEAGTITANELNIGSVRAGIITAGSIFADAITGGVISASTGIYLGNGLFELNAAQRALIVRNNANTVELVRMSPNGLHIKAEDGSTVLAAGQKIAAGAVQGLTANGGNIISNSDLSGGGTNYPNGHIGNLFIGDNGTASAVFGANKTWRPDGMDARVVNYGSAAGANEFFDISIQSVGSGQGLNPTHPAQGGIEYEFSMYAQAHACKTELWLCFVNSAGTALLYANTSPDFGGNAVDNIALELGGLAQWEAAGLRARGRVTSPAGTTGVQVFVRTFTKYAPGNPGGWLMFSGVYVAPTLPGQIGWSPWSPGKSYTQIKPNNISTYIENLAVGTISIANGAISTLAANIAAIPANNNPTVSQTFSSKGVTTGGVLVTSTVTLSNAGDYIDAGGPAFNILNLTWIVFIDDIEIGRFIMTKTLVGSAGAGGYLTRAFWSYVPCSGQFMKYNLSEGVHTARCTCQGTMPVNMNVSIVVAELAK